MSIVYMAKRQIYPDQTKLFGPYDSREAALACVQDSLYPDAGEVIEVDLGKLQSTYTPIPSYQAWELEETETYYHFSDGSTVIPKKWKKDVSINVIDMTDFDPQSFIECASESKEEDLVITMGYIILEDVKEVYVFREKTPGAIESLQMSDHLENLFKLRGWHDRAMLVSCAQKTWDGYSKEGDEGDFFREKLYRGITDFWSTFSDLDDDLPEKWQGCNLFY